jgi:sarcosine oxidase
MRTEVDILVIGLGAMGSAALYQLARLGAAPVGIEQFSVGHALGSSGGQSRVFRTFYQDPLYTRLAEAAIPLWRELEARAGEAILTLCGNLFFARPGNALLAQSLQAMDAAQSSYERLTSADVATRFPMLRLPAAAEICLVPQSGFLNATLAVQTHVAQAQRLGATVHAGVAVHRLDLRGERPVVETSAGRYSCTRLVVTPGPWASRLFSELGLPMFSQHLRVTRQQKFYFQPAQPARFLPASLPVYCDYDTDFYGFPLHGPGLKVADDSLGAVTDPTTVDRTLDLAKRDQLGAWLAGLMPNADFTYSAGSTCMYTLTPDRDFLLGPHPHYANTFIGAGFSGHGFKFSTLVGHLLAQLALGQPPSQPLERFRLDRFP